MDTSKLGLQNYLPDGQPTETLYNNYVLQNSGLFKTIDVKDKCVLDIGCSNGRLNMLVAINFSFLNRSCECPSTKTFFL